MTKPTCFMDVTIAFDNGWSAISSLYGLIPLVFAGFLLILFFLNNRGTRELWWGSYVLISTLFCEPIKALAKQPRPPTACATSYGMPSCHSTLCTGWLVLITLDVATCALMSRKKSTEPSTIYTAIVVLCSFLFLAPVGIARAVSGDHSDRQVLAGTLLGIAVGGIWWGISIPLRKMFADRIGSRVFGFLTHNYPSLGDMQANFEDSEKSESLAFSAKRTQYV